MHVRWFVGLLQNGLLPARPLPTCARVHENQGVAVSLSRLMLKVSKGNHHVWTTLRIRSLRGFGIRDVQRKPSIPTRPPHAGLPLVVESHERERPSRNDPGGLSILRLSGFAALRRTRSRLCSDLVWAAGLPSAEGFGGVVGSRTPVLKSSKVTSTCVAALFESRPTCATAAGYPLVQPLNCREQSEVPLLRIPVCWRPSPTQGSSRLVGARS